MLTRLITFALLSACVASTVPEARCPNAGGRADPRLLACEKAAACNLVPDNAIPDCQYCISIFTDLNNIAETTIAEYIGQLDGLSCEKLAEFGDTSGVLQCTETFSAWKQGLR